VSGSAATSDLARLALAVLQTGAARSAEKSIKRLARLALLQAIAVLCVVAAFGCAMGALLIYARPILGGAGALLVGAGVFVALALAALGLAWRTERMRSSPTAIGSGGDATLAAAVGLFKQHTGLALAAALLAGVFLGGER
jgi:uncharacterized membrane protein